MRYLKYYWLLAKFTVHAIRCGTDLEAVCTYDGCNKTVFQCSIVGDAHYLAFGVWEKGVR